MTLQRLSFAAMLLAAIGAGLWNWHWAWAAIACFLVGSFSLSNGPSYDRVVAANKEGRLSVFPTILLAKMLPYVVLALFTYWFATLFR